MDFYFPELPPVMFLTQVTDHCPQAASLYIKLWAKKDKHHKISVLKEDVRSEFLETKTKFANFLMLLVKEALVNVEETPRSFHIELVGWDSIEAV
jgi:hypothetical protein